MFGWRILYASLLLSLQLAGLSRAAESNLGAALAVGLMGKDGGDCLFYYPTKNEPSTPAKYGYTYEDVFFKAEDGVKLHGWWLPRRERQGRPRGTVVYSHGNAGSVAYHLVFVSWLVDAGYNVLLYDYRGYGRSGGVVTKAGLVKDVAAAFRYTLTRKDVDAQKLISFGHSLGGAKSIAALAQSAPAGLKGVVVDSTFASYKDMAERMAGKAARKIVSDTYEPYIYVKNLPQVPLLVVHGSEDSTIPFAQAKKLYDAASGKKSLMKVPGANHVDCFFIDDEKYREDLIRWMDAVISK